MTNVTSDMELYALYPVAPLYVVPVSIEDSSKTEPSSPPPASARASRAWWLRSLRIHTCGDELCASPEGSASPSGRAISAYVTEFFLSMKLFLRGAIVGARERQRRRAASGTNVKKRSPRRGIPPRETGGVERTPPRRRSAKRREEAPTRERERPGGARECDARDRTRGVDGSARAAAEEGAKRLFFATSECIHDVLLCSRAAARAYWLVYDN